MLYKKALCAFALIMFVGASGLFAGDAAIFVDLGFSPDGRTYMFGQYGVHSGTLRPWADIFIVDTARNNFVRGGRLSYIHGSAAIPGQNGSGALLRALVQNAPLVQRHQIDHCLQGQPLFAALDDTTPDTIEFRNFRTGDSYRASLLQNREGFGPELASSFHINLERTFPDGSVRSYTVGNPRFKRPLIASYRIRQAIVHGDSMVFVIEMRRQDVGDFSIRYMVEALRF